MKHSLTSLASATFVFTTACMAGVAFPSPAWAQDDAAPQDSAQNNTPPGDQYEFDITDPTSTEFKFALGGGLAYQFDTDIDGGGDMSVARFGAGISMHHDFNADFSMMLRFGAEIDIYDFSAGALGLGAGLEPWDDIHTFTTGALFSWRFEQDWSFFAGPVVQSSRQSGADLDDSLIYGGLGGVTVKVSKDLTIGGGVTIMSQLEDNVRVVPIIIIDWAFTNDMFLRTTSVGSAYTRNGLELVWQFARDWEVAAGGAYRFSRFRLDDGSHTPSGVGEDVSIPIWLRATYKPSKSISIDVIAGIALDGQLTLDDSNGVTQAKQDYSEAFILGTYASFRF